MNNITEDDSLRLTFENEISFRKDSDGLYESTTIRAAWFAFKRGYYIGKTVNPALHIQNKSPDIK